MQREVRALVEFLVIPMEEKEAVKQGLFNQGGFKMYELFMMAAFYRRHLLFLSD